MLIILVESDIRKMEQKTPKVRLSTKNKQQKNHKNKNKQTKTTANKLAKTIKINFIGIMETNSTAKKK